MQTHPDERGLNDLSLFPQEPKRQDSNRRSVSTLMSLDSFLFRSSSSSALLGDYIGMESCVDVLTHADQLELSSRGITPGKSSGNGKTSCRRYRRSSSALERANCRREFPPPIPSLAQTENLHSRMPWVFRRHYTGDGRLILTEEKVRHHEYFRAHRSNGRLTLHLVPVDGAVLAASLAGNNNEIIEKDQCNIDVDDHNDQDMDGGGDDVDCGEMDGGDEVEEEEEEEQCNENDKSTGNHEIGGSGTGGKCFNYSGGLCILGVAVPAIANKACS